MANTRGFLAGSPATHEETGAERAIRLAHERALLAEAREDVRAGRVVADEDVDAWLDLLVGSDGPLPVPGALPTRPAK